MASPNDELSSLLTPSILYGVLKNRLPWPMDKPLDWKEVHTYIFQAEDCPQQEQLREICWPTLQAISKLGVDNVPDMMQFLPSLESKDFPVQALGLQLLLDQVRQCSPFNPQSERGRRSRDNCLRARLPPGSRDFVNTTLLIP